MPCGVILNCSIVPEMGVKETLLKRLLGDIALLIVFFENLAAVPENPVLSPRRDPSK